MAPKPSGPYTIVKFTGRSDGDATHRPSDIEARGWSRMDPELYLTKVAQRAEEEMGRAVPGVRYRLNRLPHGYEVWSRPRQNGRPDAYLFGHPKHKTFDSPNRFVPHYCHLMSHDRTPCGCDMCTGGHTHKAKVKGPSTTTSTTPLSRQNHTRPTRGGIVRGPRGRPPGLHSRPPLENGPTGDDGLPDHVVRWLTLLKQKGEIDREFREIPSLENQVENVVLTSTTAQLADYPTFAPRVGELVIWYKNFDGELQRDPGSGLYKVYDPDTHSFKGFPKWLGGIVTQLPVPEESITLDDIREQGTKTLSINYSGFRVECLPDVNSEDKSLTKQYTHVPLSHIRPVTLWQDLFQTAHILNTTHPSMRNALKAMRTISLIGRYRLVGKWPEAHILCKGIFLGAECHWAGDVVRLFPTDDAKEITDVMHIDTFILSLKGLQPEPYDNTTVTGDRCDSIHILVRGRIFTCSPPNDSAPPIDPQSLPEVMRPYGPWFSHSLTPSSSPLSSPLPASATHLTIPAIHLFSRLLSFASVNLLHRSQNPQSALTLGCQSIIDARSYALHTDSRLFSDDDDYNNQPSSDTAAAVEAPNRKNARWHWCDTRAEALSLETFNGIDVGARYDRTRDIGRMQHVMEVMKKAREEDDGRQQISQVPQMKHASTRARPEEEEADIEMVIPPPRTPKVVSSAVAAAAAAAKQDRAPVIGKRQGKTREQPSNHYGGDDEEEEDDDDEDEDELQTGFKGSGMVAAARTATTATVTATTTSARTSTPTTKATHTTTRSVPPAAAMVVVEISDSSDSDSSSDDEGADDADNADELETNQNEEEVAVVVVEKESTQADAKRSNAQSNTGTGTGSDISTSTSTSSSGSTSSSSGTVAGSIVAVGGGNASANRSNSGEMQEIDDDDSDMEVREAKRVKR